MASDPSVKPSKNAQLNSAQLLALVKEQLSADEKELRAKVAATNGGELPRGSQDGCTINLSEKFVGPLPEEIVWLIQDRAERLALSHNPGLVLPDAMIQCDRLRYLNVRGNKLTRFPEVVFSLPKLEILDIGKNEITTMPEDVGKLTNLKFLSFNGNQIARLPLALGEMNRLLKLRCEDNPIEYPPAEALKVTPERSTVGMSTDEHSRYIGERQREMCMQVKRFMKAALMRQKLRSNSEDDLVENSVETPRPPKRSATIGRFPVRPSISGMDYFEPKVESPPDKPPPIPERSHARKVSPIAHNLPQIAKRPGVAPLFTSENDMNRSRSETVATSTSLRNRRKGFVPRKTSNLGSANSVTTESDARSSTTSSTITPGRLQTSAVAPAYGAHMNASGGETSSDATSPVGGARSRLLPQKLSSLPESRNSTLSITTSLRAVRRVIGLFTILLCPVADMVKQLKAGSHERFALDRQLYSASRKVSEVDRLLQKADNIIATNGEVNLALMTVIVRTTLNSIKLYGQLAKEVKRVKLRVLQSVDMFDIRNIISSLCHISVEARNLCHMLGFKTKLMVPKSTPRASQALAMNGHTITPTSAKSSSSRRRGPTILPNSRNPANTRGMVPPVPLTTNGASRTNTMSSTATTPRTLESFSNMSDRGMPSRSNTMRSALMTEDEQSADIVLRKLVSFCELASPALQRVFVEMSERKAQAELQGLQTPTYYYGRALKKCNVLVVVISRFWDNIRSIKPSEMSRMQKDFASLPASLITDWGNLVDEIRECLRMRVDMGTMKHDLKPIQFALKDAMRTCRQAAEYASHPASLSSGMMTPSFGTIGHAHLGGTVPATPAGAALGPAVQATVSSTPSAIYNPAEYFTAIPPMHAQPLGMTRSMHDHIDTLMQPAVHGYSRRGGEQRH